MASMKEVIGDVYTRHPVRKSVNEAGDVGDDAWEAANNCVEMLDTVDANVDAFLKYAKATTTDDPDTKKEVKRLIDLGNKLKYVVTQAHQYAMQISDTASDFLGD